MENDRMFILTNILNKVLNILLMPFQNVIDDMDKSSINLILKFN